MESKSNHFTEICERAARRQVSFFTRFLNLTEQRDAEIAARKAGVFSFFWGGCEDCERKMMGVDAYEAPDSASFPLVCLMISPRSAHFSVPIEHRDVLGSLMALGIERELLGDILIQDGNAWIFCINTIAPMLCDSIVKIGKTDVRCVISAPPENILRKTEEIDLRLSSNRLDAVIAHLFHLSRSDAQELIRRGKAAVDDTVTLHTDLEIKENQVLSVRGFGRAKFLGSHGTTKKGKDVIRVALYR